MSRRNGRVIAFQAVYSWDVTKASLDELLSFSWLQKDSEIEAGQQAEPEELSENAKEERTFASLIIAGTISHIDEIDKLIEANLKGWKINRISKPSLVIMRVAVYEMLYADKTLVKVFINEAVELAKQYAASGDSGFVNGVLGAIARNCQKSGDE